jgi:hypothetical protein
MLKFKQFVESKDKFEEDEEGHFNHRSNIGDNEIHVKYSPTSEEVNHQWRVDFSINGSTLDKHLLDHEVPKALHFVHHSIKKFIKEKEPTHLYFYGNTPQKHHTYHAYTKALAKKLGWHHYPSDGKYKSHIISKEPNVP